MCAIYGIETLTFGEWVATERTRRGWKTKELAEIAGVSRVTVENIEAARKGFRRDTVTALATALAGADASEEEIGRKVAEGLLAAGFAPVGGLPEIERIPDEAILAQIESYDGTNETLRGFAGFLRARAASQEVPPPDDVGKL